MRKTAAAFGLLAALLMLADGAAAGKKSFTFGAHFASTGGQSSAEGFDFAKSLLKLMADESGYTMKLEKFSSQREVKQAFVDKRIDAAFLWTDLIVEIIDDGGGALPCVTYTIKKRRKSAMCLWHRKEDKTTKISGVAGKTLIGSGYSAPYLVSLRDYLSAGGVDKPLWRVFKSFTSVSSNDSAFMAVAMGDADLFWTGDDGDALLKVLLPAASGKLKHNFCTDSVYAREAIIFNEKTVAAEDFSVLRDNMKNVLINLKEYTEKYPELKAFKQYMKMMEMKIIPAAADEFKVEFELYNKAVKNGWYAEAEYIAETMRAAPPGKPVEIKPDNGACVKICAGAKDKTTCVGECVK